MKFCMPISKVSLLLSILITVSCGGSGGGDSNSGSSNEVFKITSFEIDSDAEPRTLQFRWTTSGQVDPSFDHYQLQVNPDGSSGFTVLKDAENIIADNFNAITPVHFTDWINAQYRVVAVDASNSELASSDEVGLLGEVRNEDVIGYVKGHNTDIDDWFGDSVAVSGDGRTIAVGAPLEDSPSTGINSNSDQSILFDERDHGAAYIYSLNGGTLIQQAYFKPKFNLDDEQFGASVALSDDGNTFAVGAFLNSSNASGINGNENDDSLSASGAVYIYIRNGDVWSRQAFIKAGVPGANQYFGEEVSISSDGNTLAVTARFEDTGGDDSGAAYVFTRTGSTWTEEAFLKASNFQSFDNFGSSISISNDGNTLAVGSRFEDSDARTIDGNQSDNTANNSGAVYLFRRNSAAWNQQAYIKASDGGGIFGSSVALSNNGNRLLVGATGSKSVYDFIFAANWTENAIIQANNPGNSDSFGDELDISPDGNSFIVSATGESSSATGINGDQNDENTSESGAAYLFNYDGSAWSQSTYIKPPISEVEDFFGTDVAISDDTNLIVIGSKLEDSGSMGINGDASNNNSEDAGAVFLY